MIFAFTGLKGVGKSEACKYIESIHPDAVRINFKDAMVAEMKERLKDTLIEIAKISDFTGGMWHDEAINALFEIKPPIMRRLMQNYGTEVRRKDRDDYWTSKWKEKAEKALGDGLIVLVDDCRFLNEAEAVNDLQGTIVCIQRDDIVSTDAHQSETEMSQIEADYFIHATKGDFGDFHSSIDDILIDSGII